MEDPSGVMGLLGRLPWGKPLAEWDASNAPLEDVPCGLSRNPVVVVNLETRLYAIKEMAAGKAQKEFQLLRQMDEAHLHAVTAIGTYEAGTPQGTRSYLVTRFLENSIPYRLLFIQTDLIRYRKHLLDAISSLLMQIHLAGFFWGDCSLSNTLFRKDAGALQAYLVDAETAEEHPAPLSPHMRLRDLAILEDNVNGELTDLEYLGLLVEGVPISDVAKYLRLRYQQLWEAVSHEELVNQDEYYRIQEKIRAMNDMGFSVGSIELIDTGKNQKYRLKVLVTDKAFYSDQIHSLTGIVAQEMQARQMMNEIQEVRAILSNNQNRSISLAGAAYQWMLTRYQPVVAGLRACTQAESDLPELYCQVLEHKWFLSEKARLDVGHEAALKDYIEKILGASSV